MNTAIHYVEGDALKPQSSGHKIIAHICNDIGGWGAGFVVAISKRWKEPEAQYRLWANQRLIEAPQFVLGEIQLVCVEPEITIANMIGQRDIRRQGSSPPIRYEAVDQCLSKLAVEALKLGASVHMPRIGCGLAGGSWDKIEPLIQQRLCDQGMRVWVYDLPSQPSRSEKTQFSS